MLPRISAPLDVAYITSVIPVPTDPVCSRADSSQGLLTVLKKKGLHQPQRNGAGSTPGTGDEFPLNRACTLTARARDLTASLLQHAFLLNDHDVMSSEC